VDPYWIWCLYYAGSRSYHRREQQIIPVESLRYAGDKVVGNSTKRLALLEKLGYVRYRPMTIMLDEISSPAHMYRLLVFRKTLEPEIVEYECLKDIPDVLLF